MSVYIQRSGTGDMTDNGVQSLYIHPMLQSVGSKHMPQVVEAENEGILMEVENRA